MTTLTVGPGKGFTTINGAIAASHNGDTIDVQAGNYVNNFAVISDSITLQAVGGMVNMTETQPPPNDKGMFTVGTDLSGHLLAPNVTINGFQISGVAIPARLGDNGAAIRYQAGNLTLNDDWFHNNQEGLLATPFVTGTGNITISDSEFGFNGSGNGQTHGIYVGSIYSLTISDSYFHDTVVGHDIKSRAENNTITDSRIYGSSAPNGDTGNDSYQIDLPNGGKDIVTGDVLEKGLHSQNPHFIAFYEAPASGDGPKWANSSLLVEDDTFINDKGAGVSAVWNLDTLPVVTVEDNDFWNLPLSSALIGPGVTSGNVELGMRPTLDYAHPWNDLPYVSA